MAHELAPAGGEHESPQPATFQGVAAASPGLVARAGGNRAFGRAVRAAVLQREPDGAPMSSPQGASVVAPAPNASTMTQAQIDDRKQIDDLKTSFSQHDFRNIRDWSLAQPQEKLQLIEQATALDLFWVGPDDEYAIERCWSSFGTGFEAAVKGSPYLWNRSVARGVDPENIPQTRGQFATFKSDVIDVTHRHLDANEDRVVDEFLQFGLMPPWELVRPDHPGKRNRLDPATAPSPGSPTIRPMLKEQAQLAKLVLRYKKDLEALRGIKVGIDLRPFDPGNPTLEGQDIVLMEGLTTWQYTYRQWASISREVALILNAWPVLYAADLRGGLSSIADQNADALDPKDPLDPHAAVAQEDALAPVKLMLAATLRDIGKTRDKLFTGDLDPLDLTPVHDAIWNGAAWGRSGHTYNREVMFGILADEKESRDFAAAAVKLGIDVAVMLAMVAGVVGTMGGAGLAIGIAGAKVLAADAREDKLQSAYGAGVGDAGALVTKGAVSLAAAEAESARLEFVQQVLMSAIDVGGHLIAESLNAKALKEAEALAPKGGPRSDADKLRDAMDAPGEARMAAAGRGKPSAATGPMKPWGVAEELRPDIMSTPVNKARLAPEGVPEVSSGKLPKGQRGASFSPRRWQISYDGNLMEADEITRAQFDELVDSAYHEGAHAQQYFEVARMRATEGQTLDQMKAELQFPDHVLKRAREPALRLDSTHPRYAKAREFYESIYGTGSKHRKEVYDALDRVEPDLVGKRAELDSLNGKSGVTPTQRAAAERAVEAAQADYNLVYREYQALPEEAEAWQLGQDRAAWARRGLDARAQIRVDAAQALVDSASVRVAEAQEALEKLTRSGAARELIHEADLELRLANGNYELQVANLSRVRIAH